MKRSGPPKRKTPLGARGGPLKRTPINRVSKKRAEERDARDALREEVFRTYGHRCAAAGLEDVGSCFGPLTLDEIISRARWPGGHLVRENLQPLCAFHNTWKEDNPKKAERLGLARNSWARPLDSEQ